MEWNGGKQHEGYHRLRIPLGEHRRDRPSHCGGHWAEAQALSTAEATGEALAGADLIVAGAPLLGFSLPTESMLKGLASNTGGKPTPDLSHPSMRSWLEALPKGAGRAAGFETRIWWSPGSAAKTILDRLGATGYQPAAKAQRFVVQGKYGPLRDAELERAKAWGAELRGRLSE